MENGAVIGLKAKLPEKIDDLNEWYIVSDGSNAYVAKILEGKGHPRDEYTILSWITLSPAYSYVENVQFNPSNGQCGVLRLITPIGLFASAEKIQVQPRSVRAIADLDDADKQQILACMKQAEEIRTSMRAARSGIQIPTPTFPRGVPKS